MDIINILIRTIFFYFFAMVIFRIMGKREVGQLGVIDLVVSILIAELIAISIENFKDSLWNTIIPISALVFLELVLAYIGLKSKRFRTFFDGKPSLIIDKGRVNYREMVKQRYTIDDLLFELRQNGIMSIEDVSYALLEPNGKLSVFKKNIVDSNYPLPLIVDGEVQESTLKEIKKSKIWLKMMLHKKNKDVKDIFYSFYKGCKLYIISRDDLIKK